MFNVGSDMILELKGGCAIVDRPQCGLHMARGHADLFRFIQDVITKADAAPDFNAAYRTHGRWPFGTLCDPADQRRDVSAPTRDLPFGFEA